MYKKKQKKTGDEEKRISITKTNVDSPVPGGRNDIYPQ